MRSSACGPRSGLTVRVLHTCALIMGQAVLVMFVAGRLVFDLAAGRLVLDVGRCSVSPSRVGSPMLCSPLPHCCKSNRDVSAVVNRRWREVVFGNSSPREAYLSLVVL